MEKPYQSHHRLPSRLSLNFHFVNVRCSPNHWARQSPSGLSAAKTPPFPLSPQAIAVASYLLVVVLVSPSVQPPESTEIPTLLIWLPPSAELL